MRLPSLFVAICSFPALIVAARGQPVDKDAAEQACAMVATVVPLAVAPQHPAWIDESKSKLPQWIDLCNRAPDPIDCTSTIAYLRQQNFEVPPGLTCRH
jgi:hypothetical protein